MHKSLKAAVMAAAVFVGALGAQTTTAIAYEDGVRLGKQLTPAQRQFRGEQAVIAITPVGRHSLTNGQAKAFRALRARGVRIHKLRGKGRYGVRIRKRSHRAHYKRSSKCVSVFTPCSRIGRAVDRGLKRAFSQPIRIRRTVLVRR